MNKVESTFQKISKEKDKAPSYEEVVPKDDFRRGATMIGGALGVIPGSFIGGAALNRVLEAERMNTLFKTKGFKKLGPVGKKLTYLVPAVAGTAIGAGAGRYLLGSDKQYEKGRKSYNRQMKDPKIRKNFTDAYNQTKKAEQVFEKMALSPNKIRKAVAGRLFSIAKKNDPTLKSKTIKQLENIESSQFNKAKGIAKERGEWYHPGILSTPGNKEMHMAWRGRPTVIHTKRDTGGVERLKNVMDYLRDTKQFK